MPPNLNNGRTLCVECQGWLFHPCHCSGDKRASQQGKGRCVNRAQKNRWANENVGPAIEHHHQIKKSFVLVAVLQSRCQTVERQGIAQLVELTGIDALDIHIGRHRVKPTLD